MNHWVPHVMVLPEDGATRKLALGFVTHHAISPHRIQVLRVARGWKKVVQNFKDVHVAEMQRYPERRMILVLDFDKVFASRIDEIKAEIPPEFQDRVFILGVVDEPEKLPKDLGSLEDLGRTLANECYEGTNATWNHFHLAHNSPEFERLRKHVHSILFAA